MSSAFSPRHRGCGFALSHLPLGAELVQALPSPSASTDEKGKPERSRHPQAGVRLPEVSDDVILGPGPVNVVPGLS